MELANQLASLQDEVKLLKGEIKAVLKDIRAAVLSESNPFVLAAAPAPQGTAAWPGAGEPRREEEVPPQPEAPPSPATTPPAPPAFPAPQIAAEPVYMPPFEGVGRQRESSPEAAAELSTAPAPGPVPFPSAVPEEPGRGDRWPAPSAPRRRPEEEAGPSATAGPAWSLLTVASLAVWAEDALATLGPKSFHLVLDLACFAELLPPDVRDVLRGLAEPADQRGPDVRAVAVNDYLLVLRQLEAILHGDEVINLRRRRGSRRHRTR